MKLINTPFKHGKRWIVALLLCANIILFSLTDPASVPSTLLIGGFLLLITTLFCVTSVTLDIAAQAGLKVGIHHRKAAIGATSLIALLIALQSIGQLSTRDIAVAVPFAVLTYLYITYNHTAQHKVALSRS